MHRDQQRRADLCDHLLHVEDVEGEAAIHRHHQHIDLAQVGQMARRQLVMQVAQMGNAELRHIENEDRIAVVFRAAAIVAQIGGHVAHPHVPVLHIVTGRFALMRPAAQHMHDAGFRAVGEMRGMGIVHRHDVGPHRRADVIVVVGGSRNALRAFDQESGVTDKGDAGRVDLGGGRPIAGRHDLGRHDLGGGAAGDGAEAGRQQRCGQQGEARGKKRDTQNHQTRNRTMPHGSHLGIRTVCCPGL